MRVIETNIDKWFIFRYYNQCIRSPVDLFVVKRPLHLPYRAM